MDKAPKQRVKVSVVDPDPGSGAFFTPGSGMGKKWGSGSGMNNLDHIPESLETIFWVKTLKFLWCESEMEKIRIRDGKNSDPGWKKFWSGMEKIRIRDKHPGSATLEKSVCVSSPPECVKGALVLAVGQVELPGERVDLLQGHPHPRPVLSALAARELDPCTR